MWHPVWWLSVLLAHAHDQEIPTSESVDWPGPESSLATIRGLWTDWMAFVSGLDDEELSTELLTKFPYTDGRPFVHIIGWSSMELVKNLSEMCMLRRRLNEFSEH